jgi:hypothetical protein
MEDDGNYRETDKSVRGLRTFAQADSIRELTERALRQNRQDEDHLLRIDERADGLFDLLVFIRVN